MNNQFRKQSFDCRDSTKTGQHVYTKNTDMTSVVSDFFVKYNLLISIIKTNYFRVQTVDGCYVVLSL